MRLYHRKDDAFGILGGGFTDAVTNDATTDDQQGVWLFDAPADQNAKGDTWFALEIPEEAVLPYERSGAEKPCRAFLVPAAVINTYHPPEVVGQDAEEREYLIQDFIGNRCYYATHQPVILDALQEVLSRLSQEVLDTLVYERNVRVVFPEAFANFVALDTILVARDAKVKAVPIWLVVLCQAMNQASRAKAAGIIAHELAHVFLQHRGSHGTDGPEDTAADELATAWGFAQEIIESREKGRSLA